jgi:hypothetical protein
MLGYQLSFMYIYQLLFLFVPNEKSTWRIELEKNIRNMKYKRMFPDRFQDLNPSQD